MEQKKFNALWMLRGQLRCTLVIVFVLFPEFVTTLFHFLRTLPSKGKKILIEIKTFTSKMLKDKRYESIAWEPYYNLA